jgi:hypothetical protein
MIQREISLCNGPNTEQPLGKGTSVITTERPLLNAVTSPRILAQVVRRGACLCGEAAMRIAGRQGGARREA